MNAGIGIEDLAVRYGRVEALSGVDLQIPAGAVTALIGANGSGKSSLLAAIVGRVRPAQGSVTIHGIDPALARRRQLIGYVPQSELIDRRFPVSVRDVVAMGRYGHQGPTRRSRPVDVEAVDAALEEVRLEQLQQRQIGQLSGGQLKRAFVARCLAQRAEVLLLDEPFAGVDQASEALIAAVLRRLAAAGSTVFVSSHNLHALPALADSAVLLQGGRVAFEGPIDEALKPERIAAAFGLGESR